MTILTEQHIQTARKDMPPKRFYFDRGDAASKRERRKLARDRKAIAAYYWLLRRHPDYGPTMARLAHRHGQVVRQCDAKWRIGQLT